MIKPDGEMRGGGLGAAAGDDVSEDCVEGVGAALGFTSVEASGTAFIVSERDHVSSERPPRLRSSHTRKAPNATILIRTISRVFVRCRAAHLMTAKKNYPQIA
jgi:hypothetical protein